MSNLREKIATIAVEGRAFLGYDAADEIIPLCQPQWIKRSERNPKKRGRYLTYKAGIDEMQDFVAEFITDLSGVASSITAHSIQSDDHTRGISKLIENSYYTNRR